MSSGEAARVLENARAAALSRGWTPEAPLTPEDLDQCVYDAREMELAGRVSFINLEVNELQRQQLISALEANFLDQGTGPASSSPRSPFRL